MEISMVPSQFLSVVIEETKKDRKPISSSSMIPPPPPKDENYCDERLKTDGDKWESLKRKHSNPDVLYHTNGLSDQEKRDLTARLPKALLAECTVEIHSTAPPEKRVARPRFDARVSPIYPKTPKDKTKLPRKWKDSRNIRETPLNLSVSNYKLPPNELRSSSSSSSSKDYTQKYDSEDTDYTSSNAQDALQLIEAVYSDQDDEETNSKDGEYLQIKSNGERKATRPVPNLIEVNSTSKALRNSLERSLPYHLEASLDPLRASINYYDALGSGLETSPSYETLVNLPHSLLMTNGSTATRNLRNISAAADHKFSFKCEHCPNVYPNRGALWQHSVATHSVEKTCECNICGRKFYRNCSLALHLKSHSEEEYCTCKECGKSFTRLINLERHMKVHSDSSDRYQCDLCDKSFPDRANLLRHSVCHGTSSSQSRTHQCDTCGKSYKSKDHLEIHWQATHAAISCSICTNSFTSYSELARHESAVHPDRPGQRYSCEQCGKSYSQKAVLRKHMISHTGERLRCTTCGIEFTQRSSLLRHVKRMHAGGQDRKNYGGVHELGLDNLAENENLRKLFGLGIESVSGLGIRNDDKVRQQVEKSSNIGAIIERLNFGAQSKAIEKTLSTNGSIANSKRGNHNPTLIELALRFSQGSATQSQNEELSAVSSIMNSKALIERFDISNRSMRSLLEQKTHNSSPNNTMNTSALSTQFASADTTSNGSSPLIASLMNQNAFLTNPSLTAANNMALAAMVGAYGTTIESVPSEHFSPNISGGEMEDDSSEESLGDNEGDIIEGNEDFSEETDAEEDDDEDQDEKKERFNGFPYERGSTDIAVAVEGNNYVADINDNEDSDNDNFIIDEDAVGYSEDDYDSSSMLDSESLISKKDDSELKSNMPPEDGITPKIDAKNKSSDDNCMKSVGDQTTAEENSLIMQTPDSMSFQNHRGDDIAIKNNGCEEDIQSNSSGGQDDPAMSQYDSANRNAIID